MHEASSSTGSGPHSLSGGRRARNLIALLGVGVAMGASALLLLAGTTGLARPLLSRAQPRDDQPPLTQARIKDLYTRHCAACHGSTGHGDGPAAAHLFPKPRAFDESPFRFAATGGPQEEVLRAVERIIATGVPRSSMPGFKGALTDQEIRGLAKHVVDLTEIENTGVTLPVNLWPPMRPRFDAPLVERGKRLFTSMGCNSCHGDGGRGNANFPLGLTDSRGDPLWAADLASGQYKSGTQPEDLYRAIVAGVPGTPMMGYADALITRRADHSLDDRAAWAVVAYIKSLAPPRGGMQGIASGAEIPIHTAASDDMLLDPSDPAWLSVPAALIVMRPVWQRSDLQTVVNVQAVRTRDAIAVSLSWDDPTMDLVQASGVFPDGVAVMFARSDEIPPIPMAVPVVELTTPTTPTTPTTHATTTTPTMPSAATPPVHIWQWKANRQYAASQQGVDGVAELSDARWHRFLAPGPIEDTAAQGNGEEIDQDLMRHDPAFNTAAAAGNPHANPVLRRYAVLEANAEGFGTLQYQTSESQSVIGAAVWSSGRWFVNMVRPLDAQTQETSGEDVDFSSRTRIPVAFAVWDGSKGDRGGNKHISGWHWLVIR
jgi:mono/diheme cytochrome c family protein